MAQEIIIPLNGLPAGKSYYSWQVTKEFFESFENSDILGADLQIKACVEKSGSNYIGIDIDLSGDIIVSCDRCLEDLVIPAGKEIFLSVKFGEEPVQLDTDFQDDGEREILWIPDSGDDIDLSQIVYDYACLEVPMQHMHEDGQCNPDALRYLSDESEPAQDKEVQDSPFAALKGLFDN